MKIAPKHAKSTLTFDERALLKAGRTCPGGITAAVDVLKAHAKRQTDHADHKAPTLEEVLERRPMPIITKADDADSSIVGVPV